MEQKKKLHPHKLTLWAGIGSIIMMFAGLTSAYIVKRNQAGWVSFNLPVVFWISTLIMIASSVTAIASIKAFKERAIQRYRKLLIVTLVLGVLFIIVQFFGFRQLWNSGITLTANVAYSFLYVIVGIHAMHVLGGIIALTVQFIRSFSTQVKVYNSLPLELINTYWHFVDLLWIYLLIFLLMIR